MKYIIMILLLIISIRFGFGQSSEKVNLHWKLQAGDTIAYKTLMHNSKVETDGNSPFQKLIEDSEFADKLKKQMDNTNLVTYLTNSKHFNDVIEIEMIGEEIEKVKSNDDEFDFMSSMMKGTLLRGSILKSGEIHSFWLKRAQLNLISLFFELPGKPVSIGDTWKLKNIALIGNDQNFKCHEADRSNQIELKDIKITESDSVAILSYSIREYVSGEFEAKNPFGQFPMGKNNEADEFVDELTKKRTVTIDYSFNATAGFSINEGKWLSFNGVISATSLGFMGNNSTVQNYALEERE